MEAIVLAGGRAERLGDLAGGRPKALLPLAGRPLAAYTVARLSRAGVGRVVVSCAAGQGELFAEALGGLGPEIALAEEPERLGRGGGLRFAAAQLRDPPPVFALNGDELIDLDYAALLAHHRERGGAAATLTVARVRSAFGIVQIEGEDVITGFQEAPELPDWISAGIYVLDREALEGLPERGDHETSTFPELAARRRLRAYRHDGRWLTVNTPKDVARAEAYLAEHPDWLGAA